MLYPWRPIVYNTKPPWPWRRSPEALKTALLQPPLRIIRAARYSLLNAVWGSWFFSVVFLMGWWFFGWFSWWFGFWVGKCLCVCVWGFFLSFRMCMQSWNELTFDWNFSASGLWIFVFWEKTVIFKRLWDCAMKLFQFDIHIYNIIKRKKIRRCIEIFFENVRKVFLYLNFA